MNALMAGADSASGAAEADAAADAISKVGIKSEGASEETSEPAKDDKGEAAKTESSENADK